MITPTTTDEQMQCLLALLEDTDPKTSLRALDRWDDQFNVLRVLGVTRTEIRHSNVLAWLMDPEENHGLGDAVLQEVIALAARRGATRRARLQDLAIADAPFRVYRERWDIDILAVSRSARYVLAIENKVDSAEREESRTPDGVPIIGQLEKYSRFLELAYPGFRVRRLYLTPQGEEASQPDWEPVAYGEILEAVERAVRGRELADGPRLLIDNYIDVLRRDIVGDEELRSVCETIYAKHQKALDLLFEYRPQASSDMLDLFTQWAEDQRRASESIVPLKPKAGKGVDIYRFALPGMDRAFGRSPADDGWEHVNSFYGYEIKYDKTQNTYSILLYADSTRMEPARWARWAEQWNSVADRLDASVAGKVSRIGLNPSTKDPKKTAKLYQGVIGEETDPEEVRRHLNVLFDDVLKLDQLIGTQIDPFVDWGANCAQ